MFYTFRVGSSRSSPQITRFNGLGMCQMDNSVNFLVDVYTFTKSLKAFRRKKTSSSVTVPALSKKNNYSFVTCTEHAVRTYLCWLWDCTLSVLSSSHYGLCSFYSAQSSQIELVLPLKFLKMCCKGQAIYTYCSGRELS